MGDQSTSDARSQGVRPVDGLVRPSLTVDGRTRLPALCANWLAATQAATIDSTGGFRCQKPSAKFNCYGPAQIRNAYSIQPLIDNGQDGSGSTITIIDSFQNPTMANDLASFDSAFGLPAPPSFQTIA